eukprot:TRINITY_DN14952_c0_g1_i1.p2 TRINITY_DN14952_c0_g1~~TRINITY_DN14952_c0_g1_i1.p2  ORF type:complete len:217 (-),score=-37.87 TRINITY_DN14952_c0_g1_i1:196-846(-)
MRPVGALFLAHCVVNEGQMGPQGLGDIVLTASQRRHKLLQRQFAHIAKGPNRRLLQRLHQRAHVLGLKHEANNEGDDVLLAEQRVLLLAQLELAQHHKAHEALQQALTAHHGHGHRGQLARSTSVQLAEEQVAHARKRRHAPHIARHVQRGDVHESRAKIFFDQLVDGPQRVAHAPPHLEAAVAQGRAHGGGAEARGHPPDAHRASQGARVRALGR